MTTKKFFLVCFAMIAFIACSEDESDVTDNGPITSFEITRNWQNSTLTSDFLNNQKQISHYNFDKKNIANALRVPSIVNFRFVLGLLQNELQITMVGVDEEGNEILKIYSIPHKTSRYQEAIDELKDSPYVYSNERLNTPIIGNHLLQYADVYEYISKWQGALESGNIHGAIKNKGTRYRYFSLKKEVVAEMIAKTRIDCIALFLGINADNKMTTVFLQKDIFKNLILYNKNHPIKSGEAFDFTQPCPDNCD